jgi:hypothetical protein
MRLYSYIARPVQVHCLQALLGNAADSTVLMPPAYSCCHLPIPTVEAACASHRHTYIVF